jgi:hypothetical protein
MSSKRKLLQEESDIHLNTSALMAVDALTVQKLVISSSSKGLGRPSSLRNCFDSW